MVRFCMNDNKKLILKKSQDSIIYESCHEFRESKVSEKIAIWLNWLPCEGGPF